MGSQLVISRLALVPRYYEDVYLRIHFQRCHFWKRILESAKIKIFSKSVKMIQINFSEKIWKWHFWKCHSWKCQNRKCKNRYTSSFTYFSVIHSALTLTLPSSQRLDERQPRKVYDEKSSKCRLFVCSTALRTVWKAGPDIQTLLHFNLCPIIKKIIE